MGRRPAEWLDRAPEAVFVLGRDGLIVHADAAASGPFIVASSHHTGAKWRWTDPARGGVMTLEEAHRHRRERERRQVRQRAD